MVEITLECLGKQCFSTLRWRVSCASLARHSRANSSLILLKTRPRSGEHPDENQPFEFSDIIIVPAVLVMRHRRSFASLTAKHVSQAGGYRTWARARGSAVRSSSSFEPAFYPQIMATYVGYTSLRRTTGTSSPFRATRKGQPVPGLRQGSARLLRCIQFVGHAFSVL